ncbi:MAG: polysaccharide biosynthesis C-terminal domain-containing protein, partial [Anaerolineae bacterium]|nr:polysaccharide biosynthesis C-terminal domain-containing protein [Anaerolineae bacterium]MCB0233293.1 polysaccharide biosynthesis C-terminal domain-containing protein [Anaerolineae bacterium]
LWLTLPAAAGLLILRTSLIQVLLERGQFTAQSTQMTAYALAFFSFGLVAHSLLEVITRAFYALHDTWTPVKIGLVAMLINATLGILLLHPMAQGGLALANTIAVTVETLTLLWLIRPRINGLGGRQLVNTLGRSLAATLVMSAALLLFTARTATMPALATVVAGLVIGATVYGVLALALGREELKQLRRTS